MIGKFEANKDLVQEMTASGARHVGNIASIIAGTVQDVTREVGEWVTDAIEMNEAAAVARRDAADPVATDAPTEDSATATPTEDAVADANGDAAASIVDVETVDVDDNDRGRDRS